MDRRARFPFDGANGVATGRGGGECEGLWDHVEGVCGLGLCHSVGGDRGSGCLAGRGAAACQGDCNQDGEVTVEELVLAVGMLLGQVAALPCFHKDGDSVVTVDEVVLAVRDALRECAKPKPTPTPRLSRYCAAVRTAMSSGTPRPPASVFSLGKAGPIEGGALSGCEP